MSPFETFERIKKLAKKQGLSLIELNNKAGLGTRSIYHWKTQKPNQLSLRAVAKTLHTTTDYLEGKTDDWKANSEDKNESVNDTDLDRMLDNARSFDGKPMTKHDREVIRDYLEWRFHNKK